MLIQLIVMFGVFCLLLYALNKAMPDFLIEAGAIPVAALILVGVNVVVGVLARRYGDGAQYCDL
jgi:hypothetical protein